MLKVGDDFFKFEETGHYKKLTTGKITGVKSCLIKEVKYVMKTTGRSILINDKWKDVDLKLSEGQIAKAKMLGRTCFGAAYEKYDENDARLVEFDEFKKVRVYIGWMFKDRDVVKLAKQIDKINAVARITETCWYLSIRPLKTLLRHYSDPVQIQGTKFGIEHMIYHKYAKKL